MPTTDDLKGEIARLTRERDCAQANADENYRRLMAERARCAKIARGWLDTFGQKNPEHVSAQKWASDAVRDILDNINSPRTE